MGRFLSLVGALFFMTATANGYVFYLDESAKSQPQRKRQQVPFELKRGCTTVLGREAAIRLQRRLSKRCPYRVSRRLLRKRKKFMAFQLHHEDRSNYFSVCCLPSGKPRPRFQ